MNVPEAYNGDKPFIFVSYSHKDNELVWPIIDKMVNDGYRVWYDDGIKPGSEWDAFIAEKIKNSGYFIAFLSENYINSNNCKDELNYAREHVKNQLLIYLEDVSLPQGMDMRLGRIQAIQKYNITTDSAFYTKLYNSDGIERFRDKKEEPAPAVVPSSDDADENPADETGSLGDADKRAVNKDFHLDLVHIVNEYESKKNKGLKILKIVLGVILAIILLLAIWFYFLSPKSVSWFCLHRLTTATCTEGSYCKRCGKEFAGPNGHDWEEATCTEPKTCLVCGKTKGNSNGHTWVEATCTSPMTCSVCGDTVGTYGHTWIEATCTEARTCLVCGDVDGNPNGHTWIAATCTEPKFCSVCGETEGDPLGHDFVNRVCTRCGLVDNSPIHYEDQDMIYVRNFEYVIDEDGYISFKFDLTNNTGNLTVTRVRVNLSNYSIPILSFNHSQDANLSSGSTRRFYFDDFGIIHNDNIDPYITSLIVTFDDGTSVTIIFSH